MLYDDLDYSHEQFLEIAITWNTISQVALPAMQATDDGPTLLEVPMSVVTATPENPGNPGKILVTERETAYGSASAQQAHFDKLCMTPKYRLQVLWCCVKHRIWKKTAVGTALSPRNENPRRALVLET